MVHASSRGAAGYAFAPVAGAAFAPGTLFDVTQYVPGGVTEFYLSGIDATEDFRLNEVAPFVSGIRFANDGLADIGIAGVGAGARLAAARTTVRAGGNRSRPGE
jgi:hypothetical protein